MKDLNDLLTDLPAGLGMGLGWGSLVVWVFAGSVLLLEALVVPGSDY